MKHLVAEYDWLHVLASCAEPHTGTSEAGQKLKRVSGTVTDDIGETLIGVSVTVTGNCLFVSDVGGNIYSFKLN